MSEEAKLKKKRKSNERAAVHCILMGFRELQLSDQHIVGAVEEDFTQYDTEQLIDEMLKEENQLPPSLFSEAQLTEEPAPRRTSMLSEAPNLGPSYYAAVDGGNKEAAQVSEPAACSAGHVMAEERQEEDPDPTDDDVLQLDIGEDAMDL